jgi:VanZ family protein
VSARAAWSVAFGVAIAVQCWALYTPSPPSAESGLPLDKVVHLLLFAGVALLGVLAGVRIRWLVLGLTGQAVLSEVVQGALLAERGADLWDLLADLLGIALGILLGVALARRSGARDQRQRA